MSWYILACSKKGKDRSSKINRLNVFRRKEGKKNIEKEVGYVIQSDMKRAGVNEEDVKIE